MKTALVQLHVAVLLWGFTGVLGRAISLDAPVLVLHRMWLTAAIIALFLTLRRQWVRVTTAHFWKLVFIGCLMCLHWVAFYGSIKYANASIALVCLSTASVFTSCLAPLLNKGTPFNIKEMLLGIIALAGVFLIYQFQQFYAVGIVLGVVSAILSAIFTMLNKTVAPLYPSRIVVFYEMATGCLFIALLMPLYLHFFPKAILFSPFISLTGSEWYKNDWLWLLILSLCCTVWAQSLAISALKKLSSFTVTLSVNIEPVYGILLAFFFYKENDNLTTGFYAGMGLILLSVILQMVSLLAPAIKKQKA